MTSLTSSHSWSCICFFYLLYCIKLTHHIFSNHFRITWFVFGLFEPMGARHRLVSQWKSVTLEKKNGARALGFSWNIAINKHKKPRLKDAVSPPALEHVFCKYLVVLLVSVWTGNVTGVQYLYLFVGSLGGSVGWWRVVLTGKPEVDQNGTDQFAWCTCITVQFSSFNKERGFCIQFDYLKSLPLL